MALEMIQARTRYFFIKDFIVIQYRQ